MRVGELRGFSQWLNEGGAPLAQDRLWARDLTQARPMEAQLFLARAQLQGHQALAREALDRMQTALIAGAVEGELSGAELALLAVDVPSDPYLVDEFIDDLAKLRPARRLATLFALETHTEAARVEELTWADAKRLSQLKPLSRDILASCARTRHLRLPYVFWEWSTPELATPVLGLQRDTERAFGRTWPALQFAFDTMIWTSSRADASHLLGLVEEVARGRL